MDYRTLVSDEGSPHKAQLDKGFAALHFDDRLESEFRTALADSRLPQLRLSMLMLLVAIALFAGLDFIANDGRFSNSLVALRTSINAALILAMLGVCRGLLSRRWLEPLALALAFSFGPLAFIAHEVTAGHSGIKDPMALYVTSTFFIYFCFGLRFWQAVVASSLLCMAHVSKALAVQGGLDVESLYSILLLLLPNGVGALAAYHLEFHDRQRYLMEWELKFQASHDQLTGLWNRRALQDHLARAWAHCNREQQPLALALIDIDYFKNYNDTYGHISGDQCLAEMGHMLRSIGQRPLDLVARYGGEEFAVLLPNCSAAQAERLMQQFRQALAARGIAHKASRVAPQLTVSIGLVSVVPKQAILDFNKLLTSADKALYEAKSQGRNCMVVGNLPQVAVVDKVTPFRAMPFSRIAGTAR